MLSKIRRARAKDAQLLTELAHAAKRHWKYPDQWIELWRNDLSVSPGFIRTHPVYCAVHDHKVIGFYALSRCGPEFELEHLWVDPRHMGHGIGAALFGHALERIRAQRGTLLRIASDPNAEGFYQRLGARRVGHVPSTPGRRKLPLLILELEPTSRQPSMRVERTSVT